MRLKSPAFRRGEPLSGHPHQSEVAGMVSIEKVLTCSPRLKPGDSCFFNGRLLALGARRSHSISTGIHGQPDRENVLRRIDVPVVDGATLGTHPFPDVQR